MALENDGNMAIVEDIKKHTVIMGMMVRGASMPKPKKSGI
jgi:hypothetical protein